MRAFAYRGMHRFRMSALSGACSGGLKQFCNGVGDNTIDIANSSRKIKDTELAACKESWCEPSHRNQNWL